MREDFKAMLARLITDLQKLEGVEVGIEPNKSQLPIMEMAFDKIYCDLHSIKYRLFQELKGE